MYITVTQVHKDFMEYSDSNVMENSHFEKDRTGKYLVANNCNSYTTFSNTRHLLV